MKRRFFDLKNRRFFVSSITLKLLDLEKSLLTNCNKCDNIFSAITDKEG